MTGKERLLAAIKGETVDRPPTWLREGFNIGGDIKKEPLVDVLGEEGDLEFILGWKDDPLYRELFEYVSLYADTMRSWDIGGCLNRFFLIPPEYIHRKSERVDHDTVWINGWIDTPSGRLTFRDELRRGVNTYWRINHLVNSVEELEALAEVPFHFNPDDIREHLKTFRNAHQELGERGIMRIEYPSPIATISATMSFEDFLTFSITERDLFHELLQEITRRLLMITEVIFTSPYFTEDNLVSIVNFGGSEQCTPPMMAPQAFDEFVVPYDGKIIAWLKKHDILVNMHCHGKVGHALKCMVEMGVDSTDPVEPPPAGDVSFRKAREISGGELTLIGNIEFDELENTDEEHIHQRVFDLLTQGPRRLILGSSSGPISALTPRLMGNYRAWIDAYRKFYN